MPKLVGFELEQALAAMVAVTNILWQLCVVTQNHGPINVASEQTSYTSVSNYLLLAGLWLPISGQYCAAAIDRTATDRAEPARLPLAGQ